MICDAEGHTVARSNEPEPAEAEKRKPAAEKGHALLSAAPNSHCGNHVEILWVARVDRVLRSTYVCKASRTVGFALVRVRLD